ADELTVSSSTRRSHGSSIARATFKADADRAGPYKHAGYSLAQGTRPQHQHLVRPGVDTLPVGLNGGGPGLLVRRADVIPDCADFPQTVLARGNFVRNRRQGADKKKRSDYSGRSHGHCSPRDRISPRFYYYPEHLWHYYPLAPLAPRARRGTCRRR